VFEPGDAWFRTGDLMRRDDGGFYYFVDRVGDTFRWKGENIATSEVAAAITSFPGILDANVYGVQIPGADGRAGMAEIVCVAPRTSRRYAGICSPACRAMRCRCCCESAPRST
jgi:acyl-CoA synthetase (AMP-forming)/AMP-acid ligase II